MEKCSVVIPLYNKGPYIERALTSVLKQTFQDFEIIVVDDGSTDNGVEIVKTVQDSRIRLIQQENAGVSAARNRGIRESKADLIAFLDADDEWMPNFLEIIMNLKQKYPKAGMYATAYAWFDLNKHIIPKLEGVLFTSFEGIIDNYFSIVSKRILPFSSSSIAISKKVLFEIGMFQPGLWRGEDQDVWGKIALKYQIAYSSIVGSIYYLDATNRSYGRSFSGKRSIKEIPFIEIAKRQIKNKNINQNQIKDLKTYIGNLLFGFAIYNLFSGNYSQSVKLFRKCRVKDFITNLFWYSGRFIQRHYKNLEKS